MNAPDRLAALRVNPDWAKLPLFDRSNWKRVRFGEVVENVNETCDPAEAGIERYIGLEHLEPGSLHIQSWGKVADGTTFTRRTQPGQVLFGKRRAYQRKVAVTDFEAVVSGDIYVLAPKDDRLLAELLPFLCMSDRFFQHAVGTSAGSLSPRTNWTSLAGFEFDLPPLEQQKRLRNLLVALDELLQGYFRNIESTKVARNQFFTTIIAEGTDAASQGKSANWPHWRKGQLADVVEFLDGQRIPIRETDRSKRPGPYPYYGASGVIDSIDDYIFDEPLILLGEDGANIVDRSSPLAFRVDGKIWVNNHAHVLRVRSPNSLVFLEYYLECLDYRPYVSGTAQPKLNKGTCERIPVPIPAEAYQKEIEARLLSFEATNAALEALENHTKTLQTRIIDAFTHSHGI